MMKKTALVLALLGVVGSAQAASFVNGGFEANSTTGWTTGGGSWTNEYLYPPPVDPSNYVGGSGPVAVMGAGVDPITGASTVYNGNYAVRLNDIVNDYSVSTLSQTVLKYTDKDIYFQWNAVLESAHALENSDYFSLTLKDLTAGTTLVSRAYSSAGSIGAGTSGVTWKSYSNWYSSGWVLEHVDLAALGAVGHDIELTVLASDCAWGGHAGYVYLDGFAPTIVDPGNNVPEPGTLALAGLGLIAATGLRRRKII